MDAPGAELVRWRVGDACQAKFRAQHGGASFAKWFSGTVKVAHDDGACDVEYNDGDFEARVPPKFLKPANGSSSQAAASSAASSAAALADPEPEE
eukprot:7389955-Prymnesium_polylepis.1